MTGYWPKLHKPASRGQQSITLGAGLTGATIACRSGRRTLGTRKYRVSMMDITIFYTENFDDDKGLFTVMLHNITEPSEIKICKIKISLWNVTFYMDGCERQRDISFKLFLQWCGNENYKYDLSAVCVYVIIL